MNETYDKIKLFCTYYSKYKSGLKYKVFAHESGKIKLVEVTDALLKIYFESTNFIFKNKSISNYVKYFNELMAEADATMKKATHPNRYDKNYESKLTAKQLTDYWAHLRSIGFKPVKTGSITHWN